MSTTFFIFFSCLVSLLYLLLWVRTIVRFHAPGVDLLRQRLWYTCCLVPTPNNCAYSTRRQRVPIPVHPDPSWAAWPAVPESEQLYVWLRRRNVDTPDPYAVPAPDCEQLYGSAAGNSPITSPIPMPVGIVRSPWLPTQQVSTPIIPLLASFTYLFWFYMGNIGSLHAWLSFLL